MTEKGYITLRGTTLTYHYYLIDHQGNNRVVIDQSGTVEQVNHYYHFGGLFGEGTATTSQPYKYNGKELDRMHGLDWYDYGARMYDADLVDGILLPQPECILRKEARKNGKSGKVILQVKETIENFIF